MDRSPPSAAQADGQSIWAPPDLVWVVANPGK
jgi:hypothetical protein